MTNSGTIRTSILNRRASNMTRLSYWVRRSCVVIVVLLILTGTIFFTFQSAWWNDFTISIQNEIAQNLRNKGFRIDNIMVEGREHTDRTILKSTLQIERGQSIFDLNLDDLKSRIELLPWIKSARVERRYPHTVYIFLTERLPVAIWQRHSKLSVVDAEGKILESSNLEPYRDLLLILGEGSPLHAGDLISQLSHFESIRAEIESAKWIGNRRWDLYFRNGVTVRLPEVDVMSALSKLDEAQKTAHLMDRDVTTIDLRDSVRIVVETPHGAAEKYQASFKTQKGI